MTTCGQPDFESAKRIAADAEECRDIGKVISLPLWKYAVIACDRELIAQLTPDEMKLAKEYLCTDQVPAMLEEARKAGEKLGRQHAARVEAAVMRAIGGPP